MRVAADPPGGPGVLDALSLLSQVADELGVRTVRDTHEAWLDRVQSLSGRTRESATLSERVHRGIAGAVYGGLGRSLRLAAEGLDKVADTGVGPRLEADRRGRFVSSAVNGLIGDRLVQERPRLAIPMSVRAAGRDVPAEPDSIAAAFPDAGDRLVVFLHGLCENESYWNRGRDRLGTTYGEMLADEGWTPVFLRANTGLGLRENGVALTALLQEVVDAWPVEVRRIALVGHSMGGLVLRAAGAVATEAEQPWTRLVSDVVTLGSPHLGAPIARGVGEGSRGLGRLPETAAFGRILDWRSGGVRDLVVGLAEEVPPLPHARYRLVAATVSAAPRPPGGHVGGGHLVRVESARGPAPRGADLVPDADFVHVGRTDHFGLLNHPEVHTALRRWLA